MRKIHVNASTEYDVLIGEGLIDKSGELTKKVVRPCKCLIVTDDTVDELYGDRVQISFSYAGFDVSRFAFPAGEASKNLSTLSDILDAMGEARLSRSDLIVALGGGVVGDLAGFAAATLLRGVDYVQIPTTLLAQVDSSVGGKVAIDLDAGKNLAGAFWQPKVVLIDSDTLKTLPDRVFDDGMAEVIKYGCIRSEGFFHFLAACGDRKSIMEHIGHVLHTCCAIKTDIVERDERDTGERMLLNFGHTLGHAYEAAYQYKTYTHGQAVGAGMVLAARLGEQLGHTAPGTADQVEELVRAFRLPTRIPCQRADYERAIGLDKKGSGSRINLILLSKIGQAQIVPMDKQALLELL